MFHPIPNYNLFMPKLSFISFTNFTFTSFCVAFPFGMFQGMLDSTTDGKTVLTKDQTNRLMAKYPQPQLGKYPYKALKRLPNQLYADDIFHRKKKYGKAN